MRKCCVLSKLHMPSTLHVCALFTFDAVWGGNCKACHRLKAVKRYVESSPAKR